jgi:hypothetical protein
MNLDHILGRCGRPAEAAISSSLTVNLKPADAKSRIASERVVEWYRSTLATGAEDKQAARTTVVMQRIH